MKTNKCLLRILVSIVCFAALVAVGRGATYSYSTSVSPSKALYNSGDVVTVTVTRVPNSILSGPLKIQQVQPTSGSWIYGSGYSVSYTMTVQNTGTSNTAYAWNWFDTAPEAQGQGSSFSGGFSLTVAPATPQTYPLTINISGTGTVTVSGGFGTYSTSTTIYVPAGTYSLSETAGTGQKFSGWGGAASGTTSPVSVTVGPPGTSISASFVANSTYESISVPNQSFTYDGTAKYLTVQPSPTDAKYTYSGSGWTSGSGSGRQDISGPVNFGTYTLTATPSGTDSNGASYTGSSASGTLTITAKPVTFTFGNLSNQYTGGNFTATVTPSDPNATYTSSVSYGPGVGNYTVTANANGNYSGSGSATATITSAPTVAASIGASATSGTEPLSTTLSWSSANATSVSVSGPSGQISTATGGSQGLSLNAGTYTYSITAQGSGGPVSKSVTVNVSAAAPSVTGSISVNPTSATAPGSTTVTWSTSNATSVSVSGQGLSTSLTSGSSTVSALSAGTYTYTLTAQGQGGPITKSASFTVAATSSSGGGSSGDKVSWATIPTQNVFAGQNYTLTLAATNSGSTAWDSNQQFYVYDSTGTKVSNNIALGSAAPGVTTYPTVNMSAPSTPGTYTYTIKPFNVSTNAQFSDQAVVAVNVSASTKQVQGQVWLTPGSVTLTPGSYCTFTATGGSGTGSYVWGGAASGSGVKTTAGNDNRVYFPTAGTYQVTVYRAGDANYEQSNTATASITVSIGWPSTATGSLTINPQTVSVGQTATISWSTTNSSWVWMIGDGVNSMSTSGTISHSWTTPGRVMYQLKFGAGFPPTSEIDAYVYVTGPQSAVAISPVTTTVNTGTAVTFTASGGSGSGAYFWTPPSGSPVNDSSGSYTYVFSTPGTYQVSLVKQADAIYAVSNTATSTITVVDPSPPTVNISVSPTTVQAPGTARVTWSTSGASSATITGQGMTTSTGLSGNATVSGLAAGTYTYGITATNSAGTSASTATLTVTAIPVSFTFGGTSQTYDGSPKTVTTTPSVADATYTVTYTGAGATSYPTSPNPPANAGSYTVTATATGNYSGTSSGTLTIAQATPTITWTTPTSITYGTALSGTQLNATADVPGSFVYSPAVGTRLGAGTTTVTTTFTPTDTANYTSASASVSQSVTKAALTATADNQTRTYGAENPTLTISYSGFVNGDTASAITAPIAATTATPTSAVGTYPITLAGGSAANYVLTLRAGSLSVTSAQLEIAADDQSRYFADPNPALTYHVSGFVNGDTAAVLAGAPTLSTVADATSPVGTYPIAVARGTLSAANYAFTFTPGTLAVTGHPVTFALSDLAYTYDGAVKSPTVTPSVAGATYSVTHDVGPDAGSYAIVVNATGGWIGSATGTLVISPAEQAISLAPGIATLFAGQPLTLTATGGQTAYGWTGVTPDAPGAATATAGFPSPGNYTVTVVANADRNHSASNTATATIAVVSNHAVTAFTPLASDYTVTDPQSPANGQTYHRIWQDGGWVAYLGRSGVRFQVQGQAWPAVQAVAIEAKAPGGEWTQLATNSPSAAATSADVTFSVMLGEASTEQPLMPASFASGSPQTGAWTFRARVQDSNGGWSAYSAEVPVSVILPLVTKTVTGQTVPPAGALGDWFTASPEHDFSLQLWVP